MRKLTQKVWIGIGAATLVSVPALDVAAQHGGHHAKDKTSQSQDAAMVAPPRSGEAYLTDGGPKDTRVRIYRDLMLMRGHLLVGGELVAIERWDDALPHFLHPTEELYGLMERYIKLHKIAPFDRQLKQLAQAVKARNKAAYAQSLKVVDQRMSNAMTAFKRFMTGLPFTSFTAQAVVETLKIAGAEYEAAIENGRFAQPVEYQDSRGFVIHAESVMTAQAAAFEAVDRHAYAELRRLFAEIKPAWPGPMPPEKVEISPAALSERIEAFAKQASRFY